MEKFDGGGPHSSNFSRLCGASLYNQRSASSRSLSHRADSGARDHQISYESIAQSLALSGLERTVRETQEAAHTIIFSRDPLREVQASNSVAAGAQAWQLDALCDFMELHPVESFRGQSGGWSAEEVWSQGVDQFRKGFN